jgi:hypothetical protein
LKLTAIWGSVTFPRNLISSQIVTDNPLNDPKNKERQKTTKNPERGWWAFPTGHEKKESLVTTIGAAQLLDHYGMSMRAIVGKIIPLVS